jgi:ankyrin repeat protein
MQFTPIKYQKPEVNELLQKYGFSKGLDINYALRIMCEIGNAGVVRILLEKGCADVHTVDDYPLKIASEDGYTEVVKVLLEKGADVHVSNDFALRIACEKGLIGVVRVLLENGADVHADDNYALRIACHKDHTEVIRLFLSKDYHNSSMDKIITENFYSWIKEFPIPLDFKRTVTMDEGERRYLSNENWIKNNRKPSSNFSDITILVN